MRMHNLRRGLAKEHAELARVIWSSSSSKSNNNNVVNDQADTARRMELNRKRKLDKSLFGPKFSLYCHLLSARQSSRWVETKVEAGIGAEAEAEAEAEF